MEFFNLNIGFIPVFELIILRKPYSYLIGLESPISITVGDLFACGKKNHEIPPEVAVLISVLIKWCRHFRRRNVCWYYTVSCVRSSLAYGYGNQPAGWQVLPSRQV